jgi:hypothetical protein
MANIPRHVPIRSRNSSKKARHARSWNRAVARKVLRFVRNHLARLARMLRATEAPRDLRLPRGSRWDHVVAEIERQRRALAVG